MLLEDFHINAQLLLILLSGLGVSQFVCAHTGPRMQEIQKCVESSYFPCAVLAGTSRALAPQN